MKLSKRERSLIKGALSDLNFLHGRGEIESVCFRCNSFVAALQYGAAIRKFSYKQAKRGGILVRACGHQKVVSWTDEYA